MRRHTYDKDITALLVIDPYNDFISEGGSSCTASVARMSSKRSPDCAARNPGYKRQASPFFIACGLL